MNNLTALFHPMDKLREAHAFLFKKVRFQTTQSATALGDIGSALDELERYRELFGDLRDWNAEGVKLLRETSKA